MLTLYGKRQSRASRCLWALEELGLPYRQMLVDHATGETQSPEHLALNPMGKIPVLVDDDFVLTESIAINLYLAGKQPAPFYPDDQRIRAKIVQWSSWAITEAEYYPTVFVREKRRAGGGTPNAELLSACLAGISQTLAVLEIVLQRGGEFLAADSFTIADINAATAVLPATTLVDTAKLDATKAWLARCVARPAWQRVQAIDETILPRASAL